jgi:acetyl esterase/lipase
MPAGGVLLSPWVDIGDTSTQSWVDYRDVDFLAAGVVERFGKYVTGSDLDTGEGGLTNAEVSATNLHLQGLPPLHVDFGQCEVLHDQIAEFVLKARDAGVEVSDYEAVDMVHVFGIFAFTRMAEPMNIFYRVHEFIRRVIPDELASATHASDDAPIGGWEQNALMGGAPGYMTATATPSVDAITGASATTVPLAPPASEAMSERGDF